VGDRLWFGKFSGRLISDVPSAYLVYLVEHGIKEPHWTTIRQELAERLELLMVPGAPPEGVQPPEHLAPAFRELITVGYKTLAKVAHPDHGGDVERMQTVNAIRDWCREQGLL